MIGTAAGPLVAGLLILASGQPVAPATPPAARFTLGPDAVDATGRLQSVVREGYVSLSWSAGEGAWVYELQSAPTGAFVQPLPRYQGRDSISFISGLDDGDHYFRVRARAEGSEQWGPWSAPVVVGVRHHSLTTAWWLFAIGAALFGTTVAFIVVHTRRPPPAEEPDG